MTKREQSFYAKRLEWKGWDWNLPDSTLAPQVGLSRERIRQIRKLLGYGASWLKHKKRITIIARQDAADLPFPKPEMKVMEFARQHNLCRQAAESILVAAGVPIKHGSAIYPWKQINLDLPNDCLQEVWGIRQYNQISAMRRKLLGRIARFDRRRWKGVEIQGELDRLMVVEKQKAQDYYATCPRKKPSQTGPEAGPEQRSSGCLRVRDAAQDGVDAHSAQAPEARAQLNERNEP